MVALFDEVLKNLKDSGSDTKTLELWKSMTQCYEDGGPDGVEQDITRKVKEIKSIATKQLKETREAMPKKKRKKTRR